MISVYDRLMIELSINSSNFTPGSGLGGDISQFFFLLQHPHKESFSDKVEFKMNNGTIIMRVPRITQSKSSNSYMLQVRTAFNDFYNTLPNQVKVSESDLTNLSWVKDQNLQTISGKAFVRALEVFLPLAERLQSKMKLAENIQEILSQEKKFLHSEFAKELGIDPLYFDNTQYDELELDIENHPIIGPRYKDAKKRYHDMMNNVLSLDDELRIEILGTMPLYISSFVSRVILTIDTIVYLHIDERCESYERFNKAYKD